MLMFDVGHDDYQEFRRTEYLFVVVQDGVHVLDPNGVDRAVEQNPFAVFRLADLEDKHQLLACCSPFVAVSCCIWNRRPVNWTHIGTSTAQTPTHVSEKAHQGVWLLLRRSRYDLFRLS